MRTKNPPVTAQAESGRKRREASRSEILAGTRRLLAAGGAVASLSIDRIVAEAGVSRATFYVCFPDKRAVVAQLAQEALSWREHVHAEVLADPDLTRAQLDELLLTIVRHWQADRDVLGAIVELAEHDPAMRTAWRGAIADIADQAADQFRVRWRRSRDRLDNPEAVAAVFTWMLERSCHQLVTDSESAETIALAISEILWRTLSYRTP
ncbi:TetR/AcrR family transcriptional regulator [Sporichthya sp.]|uniref:TetR/AcrR family transcriptional regulator n=1 Tax=Sporichthya sp. TaxID=65475 RepID=UPI0017DB0D63|nr:TetR/AcrR family transcriptional regulator [Sporichthya sp.]MBA3742676.1 TetR/AcrR family transcriptional regulator [Sporichthya sp.]